MKQLPPDTVRLLSSSQVITSVVNVVKELLENSLDAGASTIDVKLENYGLERIEVRDNGHGIKAADTTVMAVRHFTSKICTHEDLGHLETYGFRGEALGSICAVAEVTVITKTEEDDISTQYTLNFTGGIVSQKPSHLGQGTTVSVLKIFKNLPVRRQYYSSTKKCKEELKKVQDLLMAYAIIKPDLRLTLVHNKLAMWQKAKAPDHRSALVATLGPSVVINLVPCHHRQEQPEILLEGFFPKPGADYSSTSTSTPEKTFIFVNNRPIHHKDIMKLLRQHYTAQYPDDGARNRYPILMLSVILSPSAVDVNLTPDKTQEALLTALEVFLVSLYGFWPADDPPAKRPFGNEAPSTLSKAEQLEKDDKLASTGLPVDLAAVRTDASLDCQTSNSSSSSSLAEDWIVNCIPAASQLNPVSELAKTLDESVCREQLSAEDWSRGTALADPVSGVPLQPVSIHQPLRSHASPPKKETMNAITEKCATLTAYDLISKRALRAPLSPAALFEKEARADILRENPAASLQDISAAVHERWKNLREEDRKKFEEKAKNQREHHEQRSKLASAEGATESDLAARGQKRKAPQSKQKLLDELFSTQPEKTRRAPVPRPSLPLPCSIPFLRLQLRRLSSQSSTLPQGLRLVNRLASPSAWVILCGQRLMLLNPFRVEEALLFKRLLENNILPAVSLQKPIQLTDGNLGGAEYTEALCRMETQIPELSGEVFFCDPRLVANGFTVKLTPGLASAKRHLEVTAMAEYVPFLGVEDLREILTAVLHRKAQTVKECRPLKVANYLKGEAVRLARQLPANLPRGDVEETLQRMEEHPGEKNCIHGKAFLEYLANIPSTEEEARAMLRPLEL